MARLACRGIILNKRDEDLLCEGDVRTYPLTNADADRGRRKADRKGLRGIYIERGKAVDITSDPGVDHSSKCT